MLLADLKTPQGTITAKLPDTCLVEVDKNLRLPCGSPQIDILERPNGQHFQLFASA